MTSQVKAAGQSVAIYCLPSLTSMVIPELEDELSQEILQNQTALQEAHQGTYRAEACDAVAHYAQQYANKFIKEQLEGPSEARAMPLGLIHLLQERPDLVRKIANCNLLKCFEKISRKFNVLDSDKNARLELGEALLDTTLTFFKKLGKTSENGQKQLTPDDVRKAFHDDEALRNAANLGVHPANSAQGESDRLKGYYREISDLLLAIIFPRGKDDLTLFNEKNSKLLAYFGALQNVKDLSWEKINEFMPKILFSLFNVTIEKATRNEMFLKLIELLDEPHQPVKTEDPQYNIENDFEDHDRADENTKRAASLAKEVMGIFPQSFLRMLLGVPYFNYVTEWALGNSLQKMFEGFNYSKMIDDGIKNGLPVWHQGEWVGNDPNPQFVPEAVENGQHVFKFKLSEPTPAEIEEKNVNNDKTKDKITSKVREMLHKNISPISQLENWISRIKWRIPKYALGVCYFLFVYLPWRILWYTILTPARYYWNRHLANQTERVMEVLHLDINEHLFCALMKVFLQKLKSLQEPAPRQFDALDNLALLV